MDENIKSKIDGLVNEMHLDEKIGMVHGDGLFRTKGVERLGIPPLTMSDGPMGVRNEFKNNQWVPAGNSDDYVTYLPCVSAVAATWNQELAYLNGKVLGEEARGRRKDVILAPGMNIKRSPLCGRNFEYISEDPYLTGEIAVPFVQGIQESDTAACVKHFAMNNQETDRLIVEAVVEERAMREIYLPAFLKVVKEADTYCLMGAYNRFRNEYCCESKFLLNHVLREEWDFNGVVISDWGGVHNTIEAAESGLDIEMSVTDNFDKYSLAQPLKEAILSGKVSENLLDEKVKNILHLMFRLHMLEGEKRDPGCYNTKEHQESALEIARESVVLLKNEKDILPLSKEHVKKVLVIGDNAARIHSSGGGSAEIKALYEITPLMGIKKLLGGNADVVYSQGYLADDFRDDNNDLNWQADSLNQEEGCAQHSKSSDMTVEDKKKSHQETLRLEAVEMASQFDTVIYIGGLNHNHDLEGHDRFDMKLPYHQDILLQELLNVQPNTIVVMIGGSPVEMSSWINSAKSVVWAWYAGMEGGTALADVLFGNVNPSGRLPESFPIQHLDCPAHNIGEFPGNRTVNYKEGNFVGYRYYETFNVPVQFPFGFGLSYTDFAYENLSISGQSQNCFYVHIDIVNIGQHVGKETVQLYVGKKCENQLNNNTENKLLACDFAVRELKGFKKIELRPGQRKRLLFKLYQKDFEFYSKDRKCFEVVPSVYNIYIGKSVNEILAEGEADIIKYN